MTNKFQSSDSDAEIIDTDRRKVLSRLGLVASAAYVVPVLMTLSSTAHASDGGGSGGGGGSGAGACTQVTSTAAG